MASTKKEQSENKSKKFVSDKQHIKLLQKELDKQSKQAIEAKKLLVDTQYAYTELLEIIASKNKSEEFWIQKFDKLAKQHDDVFAFLYKTINDMKDAFNKGALLTGEVTLEDAEYHMNLILRLVAHRFLKEEKEN